MQFHVRLYLTQVNYLLWSHDIQYLSKKIVDISQHSTMYHLTKTEMISLPHCMGIQFMQAKSRLAIRVFNMCRHCDEMSE